MAERTDTAGVLVALDPGSPAYEAARAVLVMRLREIGRGGYDEMANDLEQGDLMQVPAWIAMQEIARALATVTPEAL